MSAVPVRALAESYNDSAIAKRFPASRLWPVQEKGRDVFYGWWLGGVNYKRTSDLYGAFPRNYLPRMDALFAPLQAAGRTLHAFSGSLPPSPGYLRVDLHAARGADITCRVEELWWWWHFDKAGRDWRTAATGDAGLFPDLFRLAHADPPYSPPDAVKYGTPMPHRPSCMRSLAAVVEAGGYCAWMDEQAPIHRGQEWEVAMRIAILRSTNQRLRSVTVFRRTDREASVIAAAARFGKDGPPRPGRAGSARKTILQPSRVSARAARAPHGTLALFD